MEITSHALWTMIHGMFFGALYLLAWGDFIALQRRPFRPNPDPASRVSCGFT
ncbi:MAG: hypothetical protein M3Y27_02020 [Acidobacteriota bacterium]|nr:hypothetical protein [Acidobacteriota bacterium]